MPACHTGLMSPSQRKPNVGSATQRKSSALDLEQTEGKPLHSGSLRYKNLSGETFSVSRLDWLATEFSVTTADGITHPMVDAVAFVSGKGGEA